MRIEPRSQARSASGAMERGAGHVLLRFSNCSFSASSFAKGELGSGSRSRPDGLSALLNEP
jgi:hypothetical protein